LRGPGSGERKVLLPLRPTSFLDSYEAE
jgi:hypothetical protein